MSAKKWVAAGAGVVIIVVGSYAALRHKASPQNPASAGGDSGAVPVQLTLHVDLDEEFTSKKDNEREHFNGTGELKANEDLTQKFVMTSYPDGSAGFDDMPGSTGSASGSFHYSGSEDDTDTSLGTTTHKMEVAGSLDNLNSVSPAFSDIGKGFVIPSSMIGSGKLASCSSSGPAANGAHECYVVGHPDIALTQNCNGTDTPESQGTCAGFRFDFRVHPQPDSGMLAQAAQSSEANDFNQYKEDAKDALSLFSNKDWWGSTTTGGSTTGYSVQFDDSRKYDTTNQSDGTKETGKKHIHLTVRISRM